MKKTERVSLTSFAKARALKRKTCTVCGLAKPLRRDVEAGIKKGVSSAMIADWLKSQGIAISETSVKRHRRNHVEVAI